MIRRLQWRVENTSGRVGFDDYVNFQERKLPLCILAQRLHISKYNRFSSGNPLELLACFSQCTVQCLLQWRTPEKEPTAKVTTSPCNTSSSASQPFFYKLASNGSLTCTFSTEQKHATQPFKMRSLLEEPGKCYITATVVRFPLLKHS